MTLNIVATENLYLERLDVTTVFLYDEIDKDIYIYIYIYMQQSIGFVVSDKEDLMCKLRKSLYGLKQAPRLWYKKFDGFMTNDGFIRCQEDHCYYHKILNNSFIILLLYVDDILIVRPNM